MALVMALGIMLVLAIALTTVITFTRRRRARLASRQRRPEGDALAEAGVNNALAVLTQNYPRHRRLPGRPEPAAVADDHVPERHRRPGPA